MYPILNFLNPAGVVVIAFILHPWVAVVDRISGDILDYLDWNEFILNHALILEF